MQGYGTFNRICCFHDSEEYLTYHRTHSGARQIRVLERRPHRLVRRPIPRRTRQRLGERHGGIRIIGITVLGGGSSMLCGVSLGWSGLTARKRC
jgi:hypothetical protein